MTDRRHDGPTTTARALVAVLVLAAMLGIAPALADSVSDDTAPDAENPVLSAPTTMAPTSTEVPALVIAAPSTTLLPDPVPPTTTVAPSPPDATARAAPESLSTAGVEITKTALTPSIFERDDAEYEITVANTGNLALMSVEVTDPYADDCDSSIGSLQPAGEADDSVTYTCSSFWVRDYYADVNGGIDDDLFTNEATVVACAEHEYYESGGDETCDEEVGDSDTAPVTLLERVPGITITKTALVDEAFEGESVAFRIEVTNSGDYRLFDVSVTDDLAYDCDGSVDLPEDELDIGESVDFLCWAYDVDDLDDDVEDAMFTNTATVEGYYDGCGECYDQVTGGPSSASVDLIAFEPGISITKTALTESVLEGEQATFEITVANTGNVVLGQVEVTDEWASDCYRDLGSFAVGDDITYECTAYDVDDFSDDVGDGVFTNVAVVQGVADDPGCFEDGSSEASTEDYYDCEVEVGDEDNAVVTVVPLDPGISITKTALDDDVLPGENVDFRIEVENTGNVRLDPVWVEDALVTDCEVGEADGLTLEAGESTSYECTATAVSGTGDGDENDATFTNVASAFGDVATPSCDGGFDDAGALAEFVEIACEVSDEDDATVTLVDPSVEITKTALGAAVQAGGAVQFAITVTNTGDVTLTGLAVLDPRTANCRRTGITLTPGQTAAYQCTAVNVTDLSDQATDGRFTNVADVVGSYRSRALSDRATAAVTVTAPPVGPPVDPPPSPPDEPGILTITPIIVFDPPTVQTDPPLVETPDEPDEPDDPDDPDDPEPSITIIGDATTLVTGGTIRLEGPTPGCELSVLIDGALVAAQDGSDDPGAFSFLVGTSGLDAGRHTATVQCADGTTVFERPFTLVHPIANNSGATGIVAFMVLLIMLLGWRFVLSSGSNQET